MIKMAGVQWIEQGETGLSADVNGAHCSVICLAFDDHPWAARVRRGDTGLEYRSLTRQDAAFWAARTARGNGPELRPLKKTTP